MKIGTIVLNKGAGKKNPIRFFIYTGIKGRFATGINIWNGKLEKCEYYKDDFKDKAKFEEVGYCNAFDMMKAQLQELLGGG